MVYQAPFKRERHECSSKSDEVAKKGQQGPQESAYSNVCGASEEAHKHAVTRPLMIPLPCKLRVHELIDWTGINLESNQITIKKKKKKEQRTLR